MTAGGGDNSDADGGDHGATDDRRDGTINGSRINSSALDLATSQSESLTLSWVASSMVITLAAGAVALTPAGCCSIVICGEHGEATLMWIQAMATSSAGRAQVAAGTDEGIKGFTRGEGGAQRTVGRLDRDTSEEGRAEGREGR